MELLHGVGAKECNIMMHLRSPSVSANPQGRKYATRSISIEKFYASPWVSPNQARADQRSTPKETREYGFRRSNAGMMPHHA